MIAGGIYIGSQSPAFARTQQTLLSVEKSRIDRITIDEGDGKLTQLSKMDGKWKLPGFHQLPASQSKVDAAIDMLANAKTGWPVATTEGGRKRFEVLDDSFQKRVTLSQGDDE